MRHNGWHRAMSHKKLAKTMNEIVKHGFSPYLYHLDTRSVKGIDFVQRKSHQPKPFKLLPGATELGCGSVAGCCAFMHK